MDNHSIHKDRIINYLLIKAITLEDIGLLNGKMGIAIFLYHLAKSTKNTAYRNIADMLVDDIWGNIYDELPINFSQGFSGIGWGIEYLIDNKFVDSDRNEICKPIDQKIMQFDMTRLINNSLEKGLEGLLHYVLYRLNGGNKNTNFDADYLDNLYKAIIRFTHKKTTVATLLENEFVKYYENETEIMYPFSTLFFINDTIHMKNEFPYFYNMGLQNGLAGYLYNIIMANDGEKGIQQ